MAIVTLLIAAPILSLAALLIALTSRGSVLFRQRRVGQGGREFVMYKLRTMRQRNTGLQVTAADDPRVTSVGKILRKAKLDELPELWNVIRGDMALLGPRPEVPRYVDLKNPLWRQILQARPGITDPVTLRLRNEEKLLGAVEGDREQFYLQELQPYKLIGYVEYLQSRNWREDIKLLKDTAIGIVRPTTTPVPTFRQIRECVRNYSLRPSESSGRTQWQPE